MTGPVLITHYEVYSPGSDNATLTTPAFTPANGEVVTVKLSTWDTNAPMGAPTGGGQTWLAAQVSAPGGFKCWTAAYCTTISGSPGSMTISATMPGSATRHSMVVERWSGAMLDPTPAVLSPISGSGGDLSSSLTTTAANSVITLVAADINSRDPASRVWTPGTIVEDGLFDGHIGSNSVQYFGYTPVAAAGATAIGLHVPAGTLAWTASGLEVKAQTAVVVDMAATFTATGSMTDGLTREVPAAASFAATGSMTAGLTRETGMAASFAATGSMTAGMVAETRLAASFTATASMAAALNVPTSGPVDPIGMPVALALLGCLTQQMNTLPTPPAKIQLRAGGETGPLIGPNVDECCPGLAWVRIVEIYPSWDSFPAEDNTWLPCGPLGYAVVLEMGSAFCMPWSDSEEGFENLDPPSGDDWLGAASTAMQHQTLMRRAAACCFGQFQRRAVGGWQPLSVEGGCTGGTLKVTVSVIAPCGDC
jgi:hypothetical protein